MISMFEEGYILNNSDFNAMTSSELADVKQIDWVSYLGMEEKTVNGKKVRNVKENGYDQTEIRSAKSAL